MPSWHVRLQTALDTRGVSWPDLVRATGLTAQSVYAWKPDAARRVKMIDADNAAAVCSFLHINSEWLFFGTGPSGLNADTPSPAHRIVLTFEEIDLIKNLRSIPSAESKALALIIKKLAG